MPRVSFFRLLLSFLILPAALPAARPLPEAAKISFAAAGALGLAGGAGLAYTVYRSEKLQKQRIQALKHIVAAANEKDGAKNTVVQRLVAGGAQQATDAAALMSQGAENKNDQWLTAATDLERIYEQARKNRTWQKIAGGTLGAAGVFAALGAGLTLYDEHLAEKAHDRRIARDQKIRVREAALGHYESLKKDCYLAGGNSSRHQALGRLKDVIAEHRVDLSTEETTSVRALCKAMYDYFVARDDMVSAYEALAGGAHIAGDNFEAELKHWGMLSGDDLSVALKLRQQILDDRLSDDAELKALMKKEEEAGASDAEARVKLYREKKEAGDDEVAAQVLVGGKVHQSGLGEWSRLASDRKAFAEWMKDVSRDVAREAFASPVGKYHQVCRQACKYEHACSVESCDGGGVGISCEHTKDLPPKTPLEVLREAQVYASLLVKYTRNPGTEGGRLNGILFDLYEREKALLNGKKGGYTDEMLEQLMVGRLALAQLAPADDCDGILLGGVVLTHDDECYVREWLDNNRDRLEAAVGKAVEEYVAEGNTVFGGVHAQLAKETRAAAEAATKRYSSGGAVALRKLAQELGIDADARRRQERRLFRKLHKEHIPDLTYIDEDDDKHRERVAREEAAFQGEVRAAEEKFNLLRGFLQGHLACVDGEDGEMIVRPVQFAKEYSKLNVPFRALLAKIKSARACIERAAGKQGRVSLAEQKDISEWSSVLDAELTSLERLLKTRDDEQTEALAAITVQKIENLAKASKEERGAALRRLFQGPVADAVITEEARLRSITNEGVVENITDAFVRAIDARLVYERAHQQHCDTVDRAVAALDLPDELKRPEHVAEGRREFVDQAARLHAHIALKKAQEAWREKEFKKRLHAIAEVSDAEKQSTAAANAFLETLIPSSATWCRSHEATVGSAQNLGQMSLDNFFAPIHQGRKWLFYGTDARYQSQAESFLAVARQSVAMVKQLQETVYKRRKLERKK